MKRFSWWHPVGCYTANLTLLPAPWVCSWWALARRQNLPLICSIRFESRRFACTSKRWILTFLRYRWTTASVSGLTLSRSNMNSLPMKVQKALHIPKGCSSHTSLSLKSPRSIYANLCKPVMQIETRNMQTRNADWIKFLEILNRNQHQTSFFQSLWWLWEMLKFYLESP